MAFAWEVKNCSSSHAGFDVNGFRFNLHSLVLSITFEDDSFEAYFLLAAVEELLERALDINC